MWKKTVRNVDVAGKRVLVMPPQTDFYTVEQHNGYAQDAMYAQR